MNWASALEETRDGHYGHFERLASGAIDPTHQHKDGGWWWFNETWTDEFGPFPTRGEALVSLKRYCAECLGGAGEGGRVNIEDELAVFSTQTNTTFAMECWLEWDRAGGTIRIHLSSPIPQASDPVIVEITGLPVTEKLIGLVPGNPMTISLADGTVHLPVPLEPMVTGSYNTSLGTMAPCIATTDSIEIGQHVGPDLRGAILACAAPPYDMPPGEGQLPVTAGSLNCHPGAAAHQGVPLPPFDSHGLPGYVEGSPVTGEEGQ